MTKEPQTEQQTLDDLSKQHGELRIYRTPHGVLALKGASLPDYQRFTDKIAGDKGSKFASMREIVLCCRVYPDREAALSIIAKMPGLVLQAASGIQELSGAEVEAEVKKG